MQIDGDLQCGVDLIEIERIESAVQRWGDRFLRRVWTKSELEYCKGRYPELAARFAGKEAVSKALGTGLDGIIWREIEIVSGHGGKPLVYLHGAAKERAISLGLNTWVISLSHTRNMACAFVVASAGK